jgi:segregation and condensation protein B
MSQRKKARSNRPAGKQDGNQDGTHGVLSISEDDTASPSENPPPEASTEPAEEDAFVHEQAAMDAEPAAVEEALLGDSAEEEDLPLETLTDERLESVIESILFASDKALGMADLKRLLGLRDTKRIAAALDSLSDKRFSSGIQVVNLAGGWHVRTNPHNSQFVGKLLAGKPVRLSRAMLETLAIVAYRQPITRPEIDDIRGVDCGPVLKTLLDRGLVRIIGKKEDVGRPILYGTTAEFLRVFSLKDLTELPTLRQFHELSAEHQAKVGLAPEVAGGEAAEPAGVEADTGSQAAPLGPAEIAIGPDPAEDDGILDELERASEAAARAASPLTPEPGAPS